MSQFTDRLTFHEKSREQSPRCMSLSESLRNTKNKMKITALSLCLSKYMRNNYPQYLGKERNRHLCAKIKGSYPQALEIITRKFPDKKTTLPSLIRLFCSSVELSNTCSHRIPLIPLSRRLLSSCVDEAPLKIINSSIRAITS